MDATGEMKRAADEGILAASAAGGCGNPCALCPKRFSCSAAEVMRASLPRNEQRAA